MPFLLVDLFCEKVEQFCKLGFSRSQLPKAVETVIAQDIFWVCCAQMLLRSSSLEETPLCVSIHKPFSAGAHCWAREQ